MIKLLIKLLRLLLVLIIVVAASGFAYHFGWLKAHPLAAQIQRLQHVQLKNWEDVKNVWQGTDSNEASIIESKFAFDQANLEKLSSNAGEQIKVMSERALEAGKVAKDFVAGSVQMDENEDKKLSERAFEYGQYIYCKAVVNDWEKQENNNDF